MRKKFWSTAQGEALKRADWHLRANAFVVFYLILAGFSFALREESGSSKTSWLTVHLLLLGATTNAIITWSEHFVAALLWSRPQDRIRQMSMLLGINVSIISILLGVYFKFELLTVLAATTFAGVIIFYKRGILKSVNQSLNKKFAGVIRFYQSAGSLILLGVLLGVLDTFAAEGGTWKPRLALAHLHINVLGWVGLTILGTLVTLWPTVLRRQMHPKAIANAERGLKLLVSGVLVAAAGPLVNRWWLITIGDALYLFGALLVLIPAAALMKSRAPDRASSWMLLTGSIGLILIVGSDLVRSTYVPLGEPMLGFIEEHILLLFTLWLFPTLFGALIYLLPVVLGRGPANIRSLERILQFGWRIRLAILVFSSFFLALPNRFHMVGSVLALLALIHFLISALAALFTARSSDSRIPK